MNNKIEITKVLKNLDEYTEEELKAGRLYQTGFEYNGKIYYFEKPVICYSDMPGLFKYFMVENGNEADSYTTYMYEQYRKVFTKISAEYKSNWLFNKVLADEVIYTKKEEKDVIKDIKNKSVNNSNNVKKQVAQQVKVYDSKAKLTIVFKNKKSYTDNDWVRGHQLLVGLEYNGKRYPFSKEIIAPDDISKFLQKVRNDTSKNRGVKLEIDAYNEIVDVTQRITNEYGGFGGKSLFLKMLDNEVEYINKEDDKIIISQKQEIESGDNDFSGLETAVIGTSIAGFSISSLLYSAEDQNLFWIPFLSSMAPFILTFATTEGGGGLVLGKDSFGNIVIRPDDGSSIVVDKDKIEQRAEYIYSKLNKNYNNLKSSIITDSKETANGILNILQSSSKEELLVKIKALEMVLKEQQEKLLDNDKGFQRTI